MIYLVVGISALLLTASFYWVGFKPLADRLREGHATEIEHNLQAAQWLVQGVLDRHRALAQQTASRTAIREEQVAFLQGRLSLDDLREFSEPKLDDALCNDQEFLGIHRSDPQGRPLLSVGLRPDATMAALCPGAGQDEVRLLGLAQLEGVSTIMYCSPIRQPGFGLVGWDVLVTGAGALYRILEQPQRHDLRTMTFGIIDNTGRILFWPRAQEHALSRDVLQGYLDRGEPMAGFLVSAINLSRSDWQVVAVVNEQRFFAETEEQLLRLIGVAFLVMLLVFVLTILTLRPIIRVLIRAQELGQEVRLDGMTGLYNHAYLKKLVEREVKRAQRYGNPFSLLMFDLDHFKRVNDEYGHPVGDQVLLSIAAMLGQMARASDLAARYGGEEFMLIMPETDADGAAMMAQRLLGTVNASPIPTTAGAIPVTVSIGVVTCPTDGSVPAWEQLIQGVDEALYQSKRGGRNCVTHRVVGQKDAISA